MKSLKLMRKRLKLFWSLIDSATETVAPARKLKVVKLDPDDDRILECAVEVGTDLIVTMDKHLLKN